MKITKLSSDQNGSHLVAVVLAILVVAAVGFTGYKVYQNNHKTTSTTTASTSSTSSNQTNSPPTTIQNKAQLSQADASLTALDNQLSSQLDTSSLNTYIQGTL